MSEILIRTLFLKNGCRLELYDRSRQIAGDRWKLILAARMKIDVRQAVEINPALDTDNVIAALGETLFFEKKIERIFVEDDIKAALFEQLLSSFMQNTVDYLAHPEFPGRFVAKQYSDHQKKASWYAGNGKQ